MTKQQREYVDIVSSQIVAELVNRKGQAAAESVAGMDLLRKVAAQYVNCAPELTQGRLFEIIETTKFNVSAAEAGKTLRAFTTDSLGDPHATADILIKENGHILREIQAKSSASAARLTRMVSNGKYGDMDRLVNSDKVDKVKELASKRIATDGVYAKDYQQAAPHLKGELQQGGVTSGGTKHGEALKAAKNPKQFAFEQNMRQFTKGASIAIMNGALAGAFVGGGMAVVQQGIQSNKVVTNKKDMAKEVTNAAVHGASRGAVISGVAFGIKLIGKDATFMKGNAASTLAASAVHCTELTYQFIKGELTTDEYMEGIGSNAVSAFSTIVISAAAGALFGPVGAAVAGTVALIGMKQLYQSFKIAREDLRLSIEEREKAEVMSRLMIDQIKEEEKLLVDFYQQQSAILDDLSGFVQAAITDETNIEETLYQLTTKLNVVVKYQTRESFDDFMMSEEVLEL